MKKKKWIIGLSILALLFIIWNLLWYLTVSTTYNQLTENISKDQHNDFFLEKGGYSYYVVKPSYLTWTGNLTITNLDTDNSIIIWPSVFDDSFEYGLLVHVGDSGESVMGIKVDEKLRSIESDPDSEKIINDNKNELELIMSEAKSFWSIK
jgi:hypothetical protein